MRFVLWRLQRSHIIKAERDNNTEAPYIFTLKFGVQGSFVPSLVGFHGYTWDTERRKTYVCRMLRPRYANPTRFYILFSIRFRCTDVTSKRLN
jgi:hypothetical protein